MATEFHADQFEEPIFILQEDEDGAPYPEIYAVSNPEHDPILYVPYPGGWETGSVEAANRETRRIAKAGEVVRCQLVPVTPHSPEPVRVHSSVKELVWAEVSAHLNRVADVWEADGSDPCRVRISREYANAYRAYAEGYGAPGRGAHGK